jgi:hypothetical protein
MSDKTIEAAISMFTNWTQPWAFEAAVSASLNDEDRKRFGTMGEQALERVMYF